MTRALIWVIRFIAVSFNLLVGAALYSELLNTGRLWDATFSPRFSRVPFVVRLSVFGFTLVGPILSVVAIFWRGRD